MYYLGSVIHIEKTIDLFDTGNYHKKSNLKYRERASGFSCPPALNTFRVLFLASRLYISAR